VFSCPVPITNGDIVRLGHGSGGKMTANLIEKLFLPLIGNDILNLLDDSALVNIDGRSLAITTDSYVVSPIFFPGGDIGSLAVHGTINDLAMRGAKPLFLAAAFILEEGLSMEELGAVVTSMQKACLDAQVKLVAADTKVVNKGAADKLFITTTGFGLVETLPAPGCNRAQVGDYILVSGDVGRHGIAIMSCREGLDLETAILSDSCPLYEMVANMLADPTNVHCLRDITRGGLASVLNEIATSSQVGIAVEEKSIPVHPEVKGVCELLGLDPLYVACEGRLVAFIAPESVDQMLEIMNDGSIEKNAAIIGRVVADHKERVVLRSLIGGNRVLDKLSGEQLPRIC